MPNNQMAERMNELICAVDEIFVGKIPSVDDLFGIHQVLVERRDAELDRQSVTDEAVKAAIEWAEREHGYCMRYMMFGDADSATLAIDALRQYRKPTDAFCDFPVDEEKEANKKFEERCTDIGVNILDERKQPDTETQQDICHLEIMATNLMGHVQDGNKLAVAQVKALDAAITALKAYQPTTRKDRIVEEVAISKTETTSCEWCEGGIDTASLMDADMMMRFVRPVNYCPNCGRPLPPKPEGKG